MTTTSTAFEGLKVLDFCWVAIGPMTTRYLADHGATVVRVESSHRIESLRRAGPFAGGVQGVNRSGYYANYNGNKYGVTLNMALLRARELVKRLVAWADVVTENFTPGTMEEWGLGYEELRAINPGVILFSASMLGRGGPRERQPGFGPVLGSLAGFVNLTGWPNRSPVPPYGAYTDFFLPRFAISAIVAALDYRQRTGKGQHLDMSQLEASVQFIAPAILDYTANGHIMTRDGNRSPSLAPHNVYPCKGDDRWCAIVVQTDQEWETLCRAMGNPAWCSEERFSTALARKAHEGELDQRITEWTAGYEARDLMGRLQEAGVPAGEVERPEDLFSDPQLAHREHFVYKERQELGRHAFDSTEFRLSESPAQYKTPAPLLGEHTKHVLKAILELSDQEIAALAMEGVLE
ncbi:MAG: CoA transferase [Chloroflexi bacterium]|nr:CoA transferase [Chloroflexota bacterium]